MWRQMRPTCIVHPAANQKLMTSNWRNVLIVASLDIAVLNANGITDRSIKVHARSGRLNYGTRFYLHSPKVAISVTAPSAVYLSCSIWKMPCCKRAAVKWSVKAVHTPTWSGRFKRIGSNLHVHFVDIRNQQPWMKWNCTRWNELLRTIQLHYVNWERRAFKAGTMIKHSSIARRRQNWVMWMLIIIYHSCIGMGKVSRRTWRRNYTISRRLPLGAIRGRGAIWRFISGKTVDLIEQWSIGSLLPTSDTMRHYTK